MNEPTNKPSRPIVVGFGSVPGGTGCTTLAIHAATYAAHQGLHTLAISIDPSADMLRRLGCDEPDIDGHWTKEKRLRLAYVAPEMVYDVVEYLPNLGFEVGNPEIIILDMGPGVLSGHVVRADFWVVPIQDSRSLESIEHLTFPQGISQTLFVLSRVSINTSSRLLKAAHKYLQTVNREDAQLLHSDVPSSGLLRRTASECKTIWELTSSSLTTRKVEWFCHELLSKVGLEKRTRDAIRRADANDALLPFDDDELPSELALATAPGPLSIDEKEELQETNPPTQTEELQAGIETNPPTQDKPNHKQQKLNRRITHGFEREIERLLGTGVVRKASRRKK